jgi:hypothetical protein
MAGWPVFGLVLTASSGPLTCIADPHHPSSRVSASSLVRVGVPFLKLVM